MKKKIIISISGGIDSSLTTILLKKIGLYVECISIKNWTEKKYCLYKKDLIHKKIICKKYKIKLNKINLTKEYWSKVFITFLKNLKKGININPDILCNRDIKFNIVIKYIKYFLNFNEIATGHFAKNIKRKKNNIEISLDKEKDQTYFLSEINKKILKNVVFPLNNYNKQTIKKILNIYNLINKNKKNSTGICFIENKNFKNFISKYIKNKKGNFKDEKGKYIKKHKGNHLYTIGEKIKYKKEIFYIYKKNYKKNIIYIKKKEFLKKYNKFYLKNIKNIKINKIYNIKIRHQKKTYKCCINNKKCLIIKNCENLITPGQNITFYEKKNLYKTIRF